MGCRSYLGRKGGKQEIRARACLDPATGGTWGKLLHEIMHTLGTFCILRVHSVYGTKCFDIILNLSMVK